MKFVDVKTDLAFRKIFGNEAKKQALLSFLNAILRLKEDRRITYLTILYPYQLPKIKDGKTTIIDVKAKDKAGKEYIVEMQVAEVDSFDKRVLYYTSKSFADQIERGSLYKQLSPIIFIGILDFNYTNSPKYLSSHKILDIETHENYLNDIEYHFIELPKFNKTAEELDDLADKWIYFIKNAENLNIIPDNIEDEGLENAYQDANKFNWTKEELAAYDYALMRMQDEIGKWELATRKVVQTAVQTAILDEKASVIQNAILAGADNELIANITGLSVAQIESIRISKPS